jgi:hypothetical protein
VKPPDCKSSFEVTIEYNCTVSYNSGRCGHGGLDSATWGLAYDACQSDAIMASWEGAAPSSGKVFGACDSQLQAACQLTTS